MLPSINEDQILPAPPRVAFVPAERYSDTADFMRQAGELEAGRASRVASPPPRVSRQAQRESRIETWMPACAVVTSVVAGAAAGTALAIGLSKVVA